ncbi:hypothetical protein PF008_g4793 [Phytophthora fragariae]|uniref:Peptidase S1 domain-containing protein n=2 Tax=Phytophthora fragariae TaxID=53985 RepID=A0A6G0SAY0_9STRA|nr:hypothetical protein PF008_g4793 [Phytophthora fragariae]
MEIGSPFVLLVAAFYLLVSRFANANSNTIDYPLETRAFYAAGACDKLISADMTSPHYKLCTTETTCSSQTANDTSDHIRVCVEDRDQYFQDEFGASPYLLVDYYADSSCHEFWKSRVFLADGECHAQGGTSGATGPYLGVVTDAEAMTIGVYMSYDGCDNLRFYYGILRLSTTNLNSDACVKDKNGYVKYYLVDSSAPLRTNPTTEKVDTLTIGTESSLGASLIRLATSRWYLIAGLVLFNVLVF